MFRSALDPRVICGQFCQRLNEDLRQLYMPLTREVRQEVLKLAPLCDVYFLI